MSGSIRTYARALERAFPTLPYVEPPVTPNERLWELAKIDKHTPEQAAEWAAIMGNEL